MPTLLTTFVLLDTAHRFSPLVLSWVHPGFRRLMLREPRRYILPPLAAFSAGALISVATGLGLTGYVIGPGKIYLFTSWTSFFRGDWLSLLDIRNPFPVMLGVYLLWNFWHFAMQNYGVLRLCGCRALLRWKVLAFAATAIGFMASYPVIFVHHWLTDIGLSARVMGRRWWLFVAGLLCIAPVAFVYQMPPWNVPQIHVMVFRSADNLWMVMLIGLATSVSFAHFVVSRSLWKLSKPEVRATIGRDLFGLTP